MILVKVIVLDHYRSTMRISALTDPLNDLPPTVVNFFVSAAEGFYALGVRHHFSLTFIVPNWGGGGARGPQINFLEYLYGESIGFCLPHSLISSALLDFHGEFFRDR